MTGRDKRGMTPQFWSNIALHSRFELGLNTHLDFEQVSA